MGGNSGEPAEGAPDPLDAVDLDIQPIWCPISEGTLNTKDLYSRPGRFIRVCGEGSIGVEKTPRQD